MRILVISQYFWPENFRINDLVCELVKRDHCVTVLTGHPNYPDGQIFPEFKKNPSQFSEFNGSSVIRVPLVPRGTNRLCLTLNYLSFMLSMMMLGIWKLKDKNFDVIFVFQPSPITVGVPAIIFKYLKKIPIVFWVLDLWPDTLEALGVIKSKALLFMLGRFVSVIYNQCDLVLGQSKTALQCIAKYCQDQDKIRFFPNWTEKIFERKSVQRVENTLFDRFAFNIVFAGNIGEAQDFPAILHAAECLKHDKTIRWIILGEGRVFLWLQKEVKRLGLEKCFLLLGRFPLERMPDFFEHADALLVTLKRGATFAMTIPGKIQSYLIAAVPVLGMLDGEGATVIREAEAGLVCRAGDSLGLVDNILRMRALSKSERIQLGQNGRAYAEREFYRDKLMERLEGWLREVSERGVS